MPASKLWGATPDQWFHFDLVLGRGTDLLPVVCNPNARLSPDSTLKALGKTPSKYNRQRQVVGFNNWTNRQTNNAELEQWIAEPDYGICARMGGGWLALDCDSEISEIQATVCEILQEQLGTLPPRRHRGNSNKCLYLLVVEGDYRKRIHRLTDGNGIIELLAAGQQAVVAGTHPSGAAIEWDNGLPGEPPVITPDQLEALWAALADALPVEKSTTAGAGRPRDRTIITPGASDDVADYLDANGWTINFGASGERYIRCPFAGGHSTDGDPTSTAYFPAGTAGFEQGHFKCLHASCAHRNDGDFLNEIGYRAADFEALPAEITEPAPLPAFKRDKFGQIEATIDNAARAVMRPDFCGLQIRFDQFRDEIMFAPEGTKEWQSFGDPDYSRLRIAMEQRGFKPIGRELIRDVVMLAADENPFDSAITWLNGLSWDGVPRVDRFFHTHFGTEDNVGWQAFLDSLGERWISRKPCTGAAYSDFTGSGLVAKK